MSGRAQDPGSGHGGGAAPIALAVFAAYYVGAQIGFALTFPPLTTSVLWPPNAILTAALLIARPRRWWVCLLAALPAHLLVELGAALPLSLVLVLFATNCTEAVLAAYSVRRLSDEPACFDTLRRVAVFILGAVLFAPFASSFLDAAAVAALRGEPYGLVWRTRFFSNVLAELAIVPALVMVVTAGPTWLRAGTRARHIEGGLLAVGVLVVGLALFMAPAERPDPDFGLPGRALPLLVPFLLPFLLALLLWAAIRFGPAGASLALLGTALVAVAAATQGRGPFVSLPPVESVLTLQVFLSVVGIPLMCLAGVVEERRRASEALAEQLRFAELLSRLSRAFVQPPSHEMDHALDTWLRHLGQYLGVDRVTLRRFSHDDQQLVVSNHWAAPGPAPAPITLAHAEFPWTVAQLLRQQPVIITNADELPPEAARDRDTLHRERIRSNLVFPLVVGGRVIGCLAFATFAAARTWPVELAGRLQLVAEVFANALARKQTEDALRASELMKSAILGSLPSCVAVLDRGGRVVAVNESWSRFARGDRLPEAGLGACYLEVWRRAAREGVPQAGDALAGIEAVLAGSRGAFALEYRSWSRAAERWFAMSVVRLKRPEGGAVVSHSDITEHKRAELEAQRTRQELTHLTRISALGELTASLAHELNQPLTGILTNAQAARRFLDAMPPDLEELRAILADIVDDDRRAGEVIQRLRELLRKGEIQVAPVDLNAVIRDVAKLLSSDAVIRNVSVALDLDPVRPIVSGDRVQLQQVVLNLLLNAMEAMAEKTDGERTLRVRTESAGAPAAHVSVQDTGPGLPEGSERLVFEPFYTTKARGMGMGLSIARSIIEAHGGSIWATSSPERGAAFHFTVPLVEGVEA